MNEYQQLKKRVETQAKRLRKARDEQGTLIAQTLFVGTLGLLLVLPVLAGAYLGHWLDSLSDGYSVRWTLGLILLGVVLGAMNVYLFIRERD